MEDDLTREAILTLTAELGAGQMGGTLATIHDQDSTPYPTFVLFHVTDQAEVIFGSTVDAQHSRDMDATPEVAFLIDNRDLIPEDWTKFDRVIIEGAADKIPESDQRYGPLLEQLENKTPLAARFAREGNLYLIAPHRLTLRRALGSEPGVIDFR
jgi:heme oxygenase (biliverdin-IX-beta and delta-forming)